MIKYWTIFWREKKKGRSMGQTVQQQQPVPHGSMLHIIITNQLSPSCFRKQKHVPYNKAYHLKRTEEFPAGKTSQQ